MFANSIEHIIDCQERITYNGEVYILLEEPRPIETYKYAEIDGLEARCIKLDEVDKSCRCPIIEQYLAIWEYKDGQLSRDWENPYDVDKYGYIDYMTLGDAALIAANNCNIAEVQLFIVDKKHWHGSWDCEAANIKILDCINDPQELSTAGINGNCPVYRFELIDAQEYEDALGMPLDPDNAQTDALCLFVAITEQDAAKAIKAKTN